jgi:hypothetical protein
MFLFTSDFVQLRLTFRLIRDVAATGTEFSRQDRKCFENKAPGKLKTSNDCG